MDSSGFGILPAHPGDEVVMPILEDPMLPDIGETAVRVVTHDVVGVAGVGRLEFQRELGELRIPLRILVGRLVFAERRPVRIIDALQRRGDELEFT